MKKRTKIIIISICAFLILTLLFVPFFKSTYDDGGTVSYTALTYKVVVWNKLQSEIKSDDSENGVQIYHKKSIYLFPDNFKSLDELWKKEVTSN